ncbi:MAG: FAD-dependent oxidoreductase [Bdellovibrionota bacterium]
MEEYRYYTKQQLLAEMERCEFCEEKPCRDACPSHCSPADFIMAARGGEDSDYGRAAMSILEFNPLGHVCGVVCPDTFCMSACARKKFDHPVDIPRVQAGIIEIARKNGALRLPSKPELNGKKVAVIGAGPAGLAAAAWLGREGYVVSVYDGADRAGGACCNTPDFRFPKNSLEEDIKFVYDTGAIETRFGQKISEPELLLEGYDAVIVAVGQPGYDLLGVPGEENAISSAEYLKYPERYKTSGKTAVVGGGAVAADCATTAKRLGASDVEMFVRRTIGEMRLTGFERKILIAHGIDITTRTRVLGILKDQASGVKLTLNVTKVEPFFDEKVGRHRLRDIPGTSVARPGYDHVIIATGSTWKAPASKDSKIFYAGDCVHGASTVVEAVASGKSAALKLHVLLNGGVGFCKDGMSRSAQSRGHSRAKSHAKLAGFSKLPVNIDTEFFGFPVSSPFLISASPHTDGFDQVKKAYESGWSGAVMKTAFDKVPIHIPGGYMVTFGKTTYGNCDNVSGHELDRVCEEIVKLRKHFPDRLTIGSTGGPVTGDDAGDKKIWQANTKKLEAAGAAGVEYSLSCPQGGDGTEGDIVSQNPLLTAKIIDWIMESGDPRVPKLFKLTAAVTSIKPIMKAINEVLCRYPNKKAGVTLANSFPVLDFRKHADSGNQQAKWDEGVVVGMSGEGVLPISYLTIAEASRFGVPISGNGGVMSYRAGANFLALGAMNVQVCTIVMKYGLGIINELNSGLSHFMHSRGINSIAGLVGKALPQPITPFAELSAAKEIPSLSPEACTSCGNCIRGCGYMALSFNSNKKPVADPARCVGCYICAKTCFAGALSMRARTAEEATALIEN